jgi:putative PIN family toxin of toxin-antitoxin system
VSSVREGNPQSDMTFIILQSVLYPNSEAQKVLDCLKNNQAIGYVSGRLRQEYEDVLNYPKIRENYPNVTDENTNKVLNFVSFHTEEILVTPSYIIYERDRNDEPSLNLCISVKADFLIARDRDLRDRNRHRDFGLLYPFLQIVTPEQFLAFISD